MHRQASQGGDEEVRVAAATLSARADEWGALSMERRPRQGHTPTIQAIWKAVGERGLHDITQATCRTELMSKRY